MGNDAGWELLHSHREWPPHHRQQEWSRRAKDEGSPNLCSILTLWRFTGKKKKHSTCTLWNMTPASTCPEVSYHRARLVWEADTEPQCCTNGSTKEGCFMGLTATCSWDWASWTPEHQGWFCHLVISDSLDTASNCQIRGDMLVYISLLPERTATARENFFMSYLRTLLCGQQRQSILVLQGNPHIQ